MSKTLTARIEEIQTKSDKLATVFAEAGDTYDMSLVKSIDPNGTMDSEAKVAWIQATEKELADLNTELKEHVALQKSSENNGTLRSILDLMKLPSNEIQHALDGVDGSASKSIGEAFTDEYKGRKDQTFTVEADVKTLFETGAGWAPESVRSGKVVDAATRPIQVVDIFPQVSTNQASIKYMVESTFTNNAAERDEGGAYVESAFALTETVSPVQSIGTFAPVTDEQLEDVSYAQAYLNRRLGFAIRQRLDLQLLVGDGTSPNLSGILDRSGLQTQAKGADPVPDAVFKAMTKVAVTGQALVSHAIFHPNDWQGIRLLRTTDGIYIWGNPSDVGANTIWGIPVVVAQALTENTGLVGDFTNFAELAIRRDVTIKVSDSHSDYFVNGKQAVRAEMRAAVQVFRDAAFCEVTGI